MKKVTFTLDGRQVEAAEGSLLIDAARGANIQIPHYCYHPALGNPGVCRLCMVEVEGMPKLQVSCRLPVKAGMVVRSNSQNARKAQQSSLEFHLANHPLDCPVCDQAGECWLQDYYMSNGLYKSSVKEDKVHKQKRVDIGRHVMLDSERCILCTRCTRFLDNVTQTHELGIFNRGHHSELMAYPGMRVDNPYSGNVVDLCPVGALTDKDFRFQVRVWYLDSTPSVCTGCAKGCSIDIHANTKRPWHNESKRVARFKPRHNPEVNGWWICDEGRYSYKNIDSPARLKAASVMDRGELKREPLAKASQLVASELKTAAAKHGAEGLAVVLSGTLSNEDLFAARLLFRETLKAGHVLSQPGPDQLGEEDELLRRREKVPNHTGARIILGGQESSWDAIRKAIEAGKIGALYVVDRDPSAVWDRALDEALAKLPLTVYQGANANRFSNIARWALPACSFAEEDATFTNFEGQVQRTELAVAPLGEAAPDWLIFGSIAAHLGADWPHRSAKEVFQALTRSVQEFAPLKWEELGPHGLRMKL